MKCYVDASYNHKTGKSSHAFRMMTWDNKVIAQRTFTSYEDRSTESELHTIIRALQYALDKGFRGLKIFTDAKHIVESVKSENKNKINVDYLKFLLRATNSTLKFVTRDRNKGCDFLTRNVNKHKMRRYFIR